MAFLRFATAKVVHPHVTNAQWGKIKTAASKAAGNIREDLVERASQFLGGSFDPGKYLLTHATIVASVDVFSPAGVKTGSVVENGFNVNRKFSDFRVTPETQKYINNNQDAWSRGVLLKAFRTFIGGHNFVEHVQLEDLSKGRIIDAAARDIGDSIYVDILIATDRKHADLVKAIESGKMGTLSMGCFLPGTHVTMADGRRIAIEDVQPGDMVLTHKGRAREVLNKQIRGGKWDMRTVHAVGLASPIFSTANHPYYVLRPAEVCACGCGESLPVYAPSERKPTTRSFLQGHDKRILNPNNTYSMDEFKRRKALMDEIQNPELIKVRADELRVGDFVAFPRVKDGEHTIETTEGKARLLGYFLAEGSFLKHKGKHCEVQFNFAASEKNTFVAEVVGLLKQEFPEANIPWVQDRLDRNTCTVHVTGGSVTAWFLQHGGEYSHGKRLSTEVMNWSLENHKHLIGTWLNGDGHRAKAHGGFLVGTTVSLDLACQMHALMAKCGWFARFEARIGANSVTVAEAVNGGVAVRDAATGRLPSYLLTLGNTQSIELQGYCAKAPLVSSYSNQNNRVLSDWVISPITAIEESVYEGDVHNMEVDEDHTYIVEGVSVANCTVDGTICTKCGHWAADETEMCPHIRYEKGNIFFDEQGQRHRIAELCGHDSLDPTGGVTFIEASWVETPAFTGAVARNILDPTEKTVRQAQKILASPPPEWTQDAYAKAASVVREIEFPARSAFVVEGPPEFSAGWLDEGGGDEPPSEESAPAPEEPKRPLQDVEDEIYRTVVEQVKSRIRKEITVPVEGVPGRTPTESTNESLVKQASAFRRLYLAGLSSILRTASSDAALIDGVAAYNDQVGVRIPVHLYRVALHVGNPARYGSADKYRNACVSVLGKTPTVQERTILLHLGRMLHRREASVRVTGSRHEGVQK